jgi:two-component system cell cycle sensor histidine kinase/response regulator CckA
MGTPLRVLLVEDSEDDALLLVLDLRRAGYEPTFGRVDSAPAMRAALDGQAWDVVIADYTMPRFGALAALALLRERGLDLPFIVVSGNIGEELAVDAMKAGAHDYIMKDNLARLAPAIERELRDAAERAERRRLEERLRQSQRLEAIGRLAGGVAHDFNNLLTAITGYNDLLRQQLDRADPRRRYADEVAKASDRAAALTHQLLAFSRKQVLSAIVVDLNAVVADSVSLLRRLIGEDVELVTHLDPQLARVKADPGQIQQVIMNLAVNARDAMPEGGTLTLETANVELDEAFAREHVPTIPGAYAMLAVCDTGAGMTADTQAHLFEPFFTTKAAGEGTGLGLATVYGIVKQSGGYIWADSAPGQGSAFRVYLPPVDEPLDPPATPGAAPERGTETILLVEDENQVRLLVRDVLRGHGYTVLEASSGGAALRVHRQHGGAVHLLITDVIMPGMNGPQLADHLTSSHPDLPVLYISGYANQPAMNRLLAGKRCLLLHKPFTPDTLLAKVRELLDSESDVTRRQPSD